MINKILIMWLITLMFRWEYMGLRFEFSNIYLSPDRLLFAILIIVFFMQLLQRKIKAIPIGKPEIFMILFFILCSVSYLTSNAEVGRVLTNAGGRISAPVRPEHRYLTNLFNITVYPFFSFIVSRRMKYSKEGQHLLLTVISIIGLYLIVIAMLEHFELYSLLWPTYIHTRMSNLSASRVCGPFGDPITMGFMLLLVFLCYMLISSEARGLRRITFLAGAASAGVSIYFIYTRSVWLGLAISLIVLGVRKSRMRVTAILVIIGIVVFFLFGFGSKFSFLEGTLFSKRDETVSYRLVNYVVGLRAVEKNPLFGIGWGKFDSEFANYAVTGEEIFSRAYDGNHHTFIGIAAEVGIVGVLLFFGIFYFMVRTITNACRGIHGLGVAEKNVFFCFLSLTLAYMSVACFVDLRYTLLVNVIIFAFGGIVCSILEDTPKKNPGEEKNEN